VIILREYEILKEKRREVNHFLWWGTLKDGTWQKTLGKGTPYLGVSISSLRSKKKTYIKRREEEALDA